MDNKDVAVLTQVVSEPDGTFTIDGSRGFELEVEEVFPAQAVRRAYWRWPQGAEVPERVVSAQIGDGPHVLNYRGSGTLADAYGVTAWYFYSWRFRR